MPDDRERRKIDEQTKIFNAITKQWLDDKYRDFGRFTVKTIMAIVFIAILRMVFTMHVADLRNILETATQVHDLTQ